jgi:transposase-like protein
MLNELQETLVRDIVEKQMTITAACEKAGITRKTFYQWKIKNKDFQEFYKQLESETVSEALQILKLSAPKAAKLLIDAIAEGRVSKSRIDAANSILDRSGLNPAILYRSADNPAPPEQLTPEDIKAQLEARKLRVVGNSDDEPESAAE